MAKTRAARAKGGARWPRLVCTALVLLLVQLAFSAGAPAGAVVSGPRPSPLLSVTLSASSKVVVVGETVTFTAAIHGSAVLDNLQMHFGDGTPASASGGHPSCAAGTSLHVQMIVTYQHAYRKPGSYHVLFMVRTTGTPPSCAVRTTRRTATIVVHARSH